MSYLTARELSDAQVPTIAIVFCQHGALEKLRSLLCLQGRNIQVKLGSHHPYVMKHPIVMVQADVVTDLAKAINKFVSTADLAKGFEKSGSPLEIAFLYVQVFKTFHLTDYVAKWCKPTFGAMLQSVGPLSTRFPADLTGLIFAD